MEDSTKSRTPTKRNADEDPNRSPKKPCIDSQSQEHHFSKLFYEAVVEAQKKMGVSDAHLRDGVIALIDSFKFDLGHRFSDVDFTKSENLCGYLYRYSQLSAELSRARILEAIDKCEYLRSLLGNKINIVSIGGGPGCDVVGFCSALYEKVKCPKLDITIVDRESGWLPLCRIVIKLLRTKDFGNASSMIQDANSNISFLCKDVCIPSSTAYLRAISNADVIIMKGLLSILSFEDKSKAVKNISQNMKEGAVLLFIDAPYYYELETIGLEKIYTSWTKSTPEQASSENASEQASCENAPELTSSENAPEQVSSEKAPEQAISGNSPEQAISGNTPKQASSGNAPEQASSENAPEQAISGNTTKQAISGNTPKQASSENATEQTSSENAPEQASSENASEQTSSKNAPEQASSENAPEQAISGNTPEQAISGNTPKQASSGNAPQQPIKPFLVKGSAIKICGPGIACESKQQIAVFMKKV